jgi:hypothetical protein
MAQASPKTIEEIHAAGIAFLREQLRRDCDEQSGAVACRGANLQNTEMTEAFASE